MLGYRNNNALIAHSALFLIKFTYYKLNSRYPARHRFIHTRVRHRDTPGEALDRARVPRAGDVAPPRNGKQKGFGSPLCMTLPLLLPLRSFSLASQFHRTPPLFSILLLRHLSAIQPRCFSLRAQVCRRVAPFATVRP